LPDPSATELVEIAELAAANTRLFLDVEPRVALLSFSTKGGADHPHVRKVAEAAETLKARAPALASDGELQADAAIVAEVGQRKAPASEVAGRANTLIFPDLNSGNIACKLVERLAGAAAIGPILQGLLMPANDLSRGCSAEDIVNVAAITSLQSLG
jgi:phosphate acetyltransferase